MTPSRREVLAGLALAAGFGPAAAGAPLPDRLAGAFVPWTGEAGRDPDMRAWERWLGRSPGTVTALDYWGKDDWAAFRATAWIPKLWARSAPTRPIAWSIPLTVPGTPLGAVAAGRHDADFAEAARAIAAAQPAAVIRLGWEMNVRTMAWYAGADPAAFIAAFRRVGALFRSASPRFALDWCPAWGPEDGPADLYYPGDDAVDIVGLDVYDIRKKPDTVEARWADQVLADPFGLDWLVRFAGRRGKPMSIPEWGVGQGGDDAYFVEAMRRWLAAHEKDLRYACYFDVDGLWPTRLDPARLPRATAAFRSGFSGAA